MAQEKYDHHQEKLFQELYDQKEDLKAEEMNNGFPGGGGS